MSREEQQQPEPKHDDSDIRQLLCECEFEADGEPCIHCGKTVHDLIIEAHKEVSDEEQQPEPKPIDTLEDEVEKLQAENERLKDALKRIRQKSKYYTHLSSFFNIANDALDSKREGEDE